MVTEIRGRFRSYYKPLDATAVWANGTRRRVAVKAQLNRRVTTPEYLFAEWCGYTLAHLLGLPTPPPYLVEVPAAALAPMGSLCADVIPGLAFATEIQSPHFKCGALGFPRDERIRNRESVSGMLVLDTLLSNNDRADDVLAVPVEHAPKWDLLYFDNCWLAFGRQPSPGQIQAEFPSDFTLRRLLRGLAGLPSFIFAAATLSVPALEREFAKSPPEFRATFRESFREVAEVLAWRGQHCQDAINRSRPADI